MRVSPRFGKLFIDYMPAGANQHTAMTIRLVDSAYKGWIKQTRGEEAANRYQEADDVVLNDHWVGKSKQVGALARALQDGHAPDASTLRKLLKLILKKDLRLAPGLQEAKYYYADGKPIKTRQWLEQTSDQMLEAIDKADIHIKEPKTQRPFREIALTHFPD